jgi:SAM-dependent methyltransferase
MPTADDVKTWYNQHYAARGLDSMRPLAAYPVFLDLLGAHAGARLLDVSCGVGSLLAAAVERRIDAAGIDLSDEAIRLARRLVPGADLAVGTGEALPYRTGTFDYVTCLGSLEHFLDMGQGLREMQRVAQRDARFCIMVPNRDFLGWKVLRQKGTAQQDINENLLSLADWRGVFERAGFRILRVVADRWHARRWRVPGAMRGATRLLSGPLLETAWRLVPLRWQYQFVFLLARRNTPATSP